jgi:dipeptidyl aminopeptidase/acylaminoacyl peptidase
VPITDPKRLAEIARDISPVSHVTPDDPPTLIIHGDQDRLVPLQQSELMIDKLSKAGVKTNLVLKKGAGHGWMGMEKDETLLIDWFDKYLKKAG